MPKTETPRRGKAGVYPFLQTKRSERNKKARVAYGDSRIEQAGLPFDDPWAERRNNDVRDAKGNIVRKGK